MDEQFLINFYGLTTRDLINKILTVKRNINEIVHNRLYVKNYASRLMGLLCEIDELYPVLNSEIIQVNILFLFKRKLTFINVYARF